MACSRGGRSHSPSSGSLLISMQEPPSATLAFLHSDCHRLNFPSKSPTIPICPPSVQYIDMSGGVSPPKGRIWRDADIYRDPPSGKTYAYVGAQSNGNLWIVGLGRDRRWRGPRRVQHRGAGGGQPYHHQAGNPCEFALVIGYENYFKSERMRRDP